MNPELATRPRGWLLFALFALWLQLPGLGLAQPFAADGGWARPYALPLDRPVAGVGVAVTTTGATVVWADGQGVWAMSVNASAAGGPATGAPALLAEATNVRSISAGEVQGELAVAWAERDRTTGRYHHHALWGSRIIDLLVDPLDVDFQFVDLGGTAYAAATLRRGGEAQLTLLPLDGGAPVVVHNTPLSVRGVTYAEADDGLWLGWLEGRTVRTEFGVKAEWKAYAAFLTGTHPVAAPLELGSADVTDERQRAVVAIAPGGAIALWTDEEGSLRLADLAAPGAPGVAPGLARVSAGAAGYSGRPLAAAWPYVYWTEAASFKRLDASVLFAAGEATPTNVLWSPVTVEGAAFGRGEVSSRALDVIAWYGRAAGGVVEIYTSDDGAPMHLTVPDRLAKLMKWNPWFIWEQAIGQALTALLIGVLGVLVTIPYLLIVTQLAARRRRRRAGGRSRGMLLGAIPVAAASLGLAVAGVYGHVAPLASAATVALALALGMATAYLVTLKGDREPQTTMLLAGAFTIFGSMAVWSFLTYPDWAPLVGLA